MAKNKSVKKGNDSKRIGIAPLFDRVLIKPILEKEKTSSGIFIPESASKEKPETGVVIAVGAGKYDDGKLIPPSVKVGDKVMFTKYGYDEIKVEGEEYFILREENILAILK